MSEDRANLLELEGVSFVDGERTVLDDIHLVVRHAEIVGVSFAQAHGGKSTLLRIAAGLLQPSSGIVRYAGRRLGDAMPEGEPTMGMVFRDDGGLFPNLTVYENVALPLEYHDVEDVEVERRVAAGLGELGLADEAELYPWELTRERSRLAALARALVYEPRLVLVDDFFAGTDENAFGASWRAIERAKAEHGTAFLLVVEPDIRDRLDRRVRIDQGHVVRASSLSAR